MSPALTLTEDMESDSGVLGMADSVDSGADVVPGGGEVHVGKSVATSATGHVTSRGRADRLVPGDAGLGDPGGLAPQTDGVPLLGRDLPAPRHGGDTRRHCNDKSLIFLGTKKHILCGHLTNPANSSVFPLLKKLQEIRSIQVVVMDSIIPCQAISFALLNIEVIFKEQNYHKAG